MLKTIFKRMFQILLITFIAIQFIRPPKNKAEVPTKNDISTLYPVPENVNAVLKTSCYDCHSNNTYYPWYSKIQPVAWWLNDHIIEGKKHLNFSEFATYSLRKQYHKLEETDEMIRKGEMPHDKYLWMHKNAKLNENQRLTIYNWVSGVMDSMKAKYPIDSLVKKK